MIEELKLVLDSLGDLSGVALWVVGAFIAYKLIIYMSTAGAFVYVAKLFIEKIHHWATSPKLPKMIDATPRIETACISESEGVETIIRVLGKVVNHDNEMSGNSLSYIFDRHASWLERCVDERISQEKARRESDKKRSSP